MSNSNLDSMIKRRDLLKNNLESKSPEEAQLINAAIESLDKKIAALQASTHVGSPSVAKILPSMGMTERSWFANDGVYNMYLGYRLRLRDLLRNYMNGKTSDRAKAISVATMLIKTLTQIVNESCHPTMRERVLTKQRSIGDKSFPIKFSIEPETLKKFGLHD